MEFISTHSGTIWTIISILAVVISIIMLLRRKKSGETAIMTLIKSIHSAKNSQDSWIRWASSFVIVMTFVLAFVQQKMSGTVQESLVIGLVALALTGKVAQKHIESRKDSKREEAIEEEIIEEEIDESCKTCGK